MKNIINIAITSFLFSTISNTMHADCTVYTTLKDYLKSEHCLGSESSIQNTGQHCTFEKFKEQIFTSESIRDVESAFNLLHLYISDVYKNSKSKNENLRLTSVDIATSRNLKMAKYIIAECKLRKISGDNNYRWNTIEMEYLSEIFDAIRLIQFGNIKYFQQESTEEQTRDDKYIERVKDLEKEVFKREIEKGNFKHLDDYMHHPLSETEFFQTFSLVHEKSTNPNQRYNATLELGKCYLGQKYAASNNVHIESNFKKAFECFSLNRANKLSRDPENDFLLAFCYDYGVGTSTNETEATQLYNSAIKKHLLKCSTRHNPRFGHFSSLNIARKNFKITEFTNNIPPYLFDTAKNKRISEAELFQAAYRENSLSSRKLFIHQIKESKPEKLKNVITTWAQKELNDPYIAYYIAQHDMQCRDKALLFLYRNGIDFAIIPYLQSKFQAYQTDKNVICEINPIIKQILDARDGKSAIKTAVLEMVMAYSVVPYFDTAYSKIQGNDPIDMLFRERFEAAYRHIKTKFGNNTKTNFPEMWNFIKEKNIQINGIEYDAFRFLKEISDTVVKIERGEIHIQ